jgi:hypothetical protein
MSEVREIRMEDENGNIYYPHNTGEVTFLNDGRTIQEFFDNGGTIGGPLVTNRVERVIPANTIEHGYGLGIGLKSANGLDKMELVLGNNGGKRALYSVQRFGLGTPDFAFSEIWAGDFLKQINGCTQLPNGFILQWGKVTGQHNYNFNFPIAFPNICLTIVGTVLNTSPTAVCLEAISRSSFKTYVYNPEYIYYMAIGY